MWGINAPMRRMRIGTRRNVTEQDDDDDAGDDDETHMQARQESRRGAQHHRRSCVLATKSSWGGDTQRRPVTKSCHRPSALAHARNFALTCRRAWRASEARGGLIRRESRTSSTSASTRGDTLRVDASRTHNPRTSRILGERDLAAGRRNKRDAPAAAPGPSNSPRVHTVPICAPFRCSRRVPCSRLRAMGPGWAGSCCNGYSRNIICSVFVCTNVAHSRCCTSTRSVSRASWTLLLPPLSRSLPCSLSRSAVSVSVSVFRRTRCRACSLACSSGTVPTSTQ